MNGGVLPFGLIPEILLVFDMNSPPEVMLGEDGYKLFTFSLANGARVTALAVALSVVSLSVNRFSSPSFCLPTPGGIHFRRKCGRVFS